VESGIHPDDKLDKELTVGTTANYNLEYPDSTSHVRLWEHFETLADDVDEALDNIDERIHRIVYRTNDQSYTSNTTLANDDTLTFAVQANKTYLIKFYLYVTGTTGGFKTQWSVPADTNGTIRGCHGPDATTGSSDPSVLPAVRLAASLITANVNYALASTTNYAYISESAIVTVGSNAGNVVIRHAQNSSSATATIVRARSWAECVLVG
jgi:hypothetical protein